MPLGLSSPTFNPSDVADAMHTTIEKYQTMRAAISDIKFKTWSDVCAPWLAQLTTQANI
jgi:hypothetical protein